MKKIKLLLFSNLLSLLIFCFVFSIQNIYALNTEQQKNLRLDKSSTPATTDLNKSDVSTKLSEIKKTDNEVLDEFSEEIIPKIDPLIGDNFVCHHEYVKVPVRLAWERVKNASTYKVEVTRLIKNTIKKVTVSKNRAYIMVYPNAKYKWKVIAENAKAQQLSSSDMQPLYVKASFGDHTVSIFEENFANNSGEYTKVTHYKFAPGVTLSDLQERQVEPLSSDEINESGRLPSSLPPPRLLPKFWFKAGTGVNQSSYDQVIDSIAELEHDSIEGPNIYASVGMRLNKSHAFQLNYVQSIGRMKDPNINLDEKINWINLSLEGIYKLNHADLQYYIKYGLNYHNVPLLEAYPSNLNFNVVKSKLFNAGIGAGINKKINNKSDLDLSLRYQHPIKASGSGAEYSLDKGYIIDANIEYGYKINKNIGANAFLSSQFYNTDYKLSNGSDTVKGNQQLMNNIFGVNIRYSFD